MRSYMTKTVNVQKVVKKIESIVTTKIDLCLPEIVRTTGRQMGSRIEFNKLTLKWEVRS